MDDATQKITDHTEIKLWAEKYNGHPAIIKGSEGEGRLGILQFDFRQNGGDNQLIEISWEDFFDEFEDKNLALLYSEESGLPPLYKFMNRDEKGDFDQADLATSESEDLIEEERGWIVDEEN